MSDRQRERRKPSFAWNTVATANDQNLKRLEMKRRHFLLSSLRLAALAALRPVAGRMAFAAKPDSLKALGAPCGLKIGVQAEKGPLQNPSFAQSITTNFNLLTPGNELKWPRIRPTPDTYNFADGDWMVNFAQKNGMLVHGHNLCWNAPTANPAWFSSTLTRQNARQYLTDHITRVMTHYKGQIDSWDVVNEPIVPWSKRPDGLYPGIWVDLLGPEYIDIAFHAAAAADSNALRVLNIYDVEQGIADHDKGRANNLQLLQQCLQRGVPIQAIGIESHLDASQPQGGESLTRFLQQVRALGLKVLITELDVNDSQIQGDVPSRDAAVAKYYADYLANVVSAGKVNQLIFWSATDKGNWLNSMKAPAFQRADGSLHRPGLLDTNLMQKPAYHAVAAAISNICGNHP